MATKTFALLAGGVVQHGHAMPILPVFVLQPWASLINKSAESGWEIQSTNPGDNKNLVKGLANRPFFFEKAPGRVRCMTGVKRRI
jgi:hypothetical protein